MPTEYMVLRYFRGTLWYLCSYPFEAAARADYNDQKHRYNRCKVQLKKCENGIISTLAETKEY